MRNRRWRSIQSGLSKSADGCPKLVKHASLVEVDDMSSNRADSGRLDWILRHWRLRMVCLRLYSLLGIAGYAGLDGVLQAMGRSRGGAARRNAIRRRRPQTQLGMLAAGRCGSCPAQRDQATSTADLPGLGP